MNVPNLSRRLASRVVETLKGRGRILVVSGGTAALVRTLDDAISGLVEPLVRALTLQTCAGVDPAAGLPLSDLTGCATRALLDSEHLEDVFADRVSVEREVLETTRLVLREARAERDEAIVCVELDLLGYVAKTAARRADPETIAEALIEAGRANGAELGNYNASTRQAAFLTTPPIHPDLPLELEETVADELCALVQTGKVDLPTIERSAVLRQAMSARVCAQLTRSIERLAARTLRRTGNVARWEIPDGVSVRVVFTPLSEQDGRDIDFHVNAFAREIDILVSDFMTEELKAKKPKPEPIVVPVAPPAPVVAPEVVEIAPSAKKTATKKTTTTKKAVAKKAAPAKKTSTKKSS